MTIDLTKKKSAKKKTKATPEDIEKSLREDFRTFLWAGWRWLKLPTPTANQLDVAKYLQNGPRRRIILGHRGMGKSWITAFYVAWLLRNNPQLRILVVSATEDHAGDFTAFLIRILTDWDLCSHLSPRPDRRSKLKFDVAPAQPDKAASVTAKGVMGQLPGLRADVIIADDVEIYSNVETPGKRAKLRKRVSEFNSIVKPEAGEVIYLGTPQFEESLYNSLQSGGIPDEVSGEVTTFDCRIWPAKYIKEADAAKYLGDISPMHMQKVSDDPSIVGSSTEPTRFDDAYLAGIENMDGRSNFRLQFMLDTSLADGDRYPLRLTDLVIQPLDLKQGPGEVIWGPTSHNELKDLPMLGRSTDRYHAPASVGEGNYQAYEESVLFVDPSGRGKDETAAAVMKCLNGCVFLCELLSFNNGYDPANIEKLAHLAKRHTCHSVVYESNFGDGAWGLVAEPVFAAAGVPMTFTEVRHSTQKELRIINNLEPLLTTHRLVVDPAVIRQDFEQIQVHPAELQGNYSLFWQMSRVEKLRGCLAHDDRLDAVAMGAAHFLDSVRRDQQEAAREAQDRAYEEWLADFDRKNGHAAQFNHQDNRYQHSERGRDSLTWR